MRPFLPLLLLLFSLLAPIGCAQSAGTLYEFSLVGPDSVVLVPFKVPGGVTLQVQDLSRDSPNNLVPGAPGVHELGHDMRFSAEIISAHSDGWILTPPPGQLVTYAADPPQDIELKVLPGPGTTNPYLRVRVTATMDSRQGTQVNHTAEILFKTPGLSGLQVAVNGQARLSPREIGLVPIEISNDAIYPQQVHLEVTANACKMAYGLPGSVVLAPTGEPGDSAKVNVSVVGLFDHFYYQGDSCLLGFDAVAQDLGPGTGAAAAQSAVLIVRVEGVYVDPIYIFWAIALALLLFVLIFFLRRRKEQLEEAVLGKPQKPWLIPVEQVYLRHLKSKDPRAWYVVRHYLMEDEYRSSMLWYKSFKAATKGDRKKEVLIVRHEREYQAWQAKWRKRIAQPIRDADRYEAKLQGKLDRKAKKILRKARRKWRKQTRTLAAAQRKALERANERHAKASKRAAKKGLSAPLPPEVALPAMPLEPRLQPLTLATHRWAKRAARYRRRMEQRQGNLEVRFERADARFQASLRSRVQRIARKLDDPAFVAEHPMLADKTR